MYYPKSQIKTSLYTNGGEYFVKSTNDDYVGYYWMNSKNETYAGKTPPPPPRKGIKIVKYTTPRTVDYDDPEPNIDPQYQIIPQTEFVLVSTPNLQNNFNYPVQTQSRFIPKPYQSNPTSEDINKGEYFRYFCKKNNENIYFEIDKSTHFSLNSKSKTIAFDLYSSIEVKWYIGVNSESKNKTNIQLASTKYNWAGFIFYFKDKF
jgi:hypothetical protein